MIDHIKYLANTKIARGSLLWYVLVFPLRFKDRKFGLLKGYLDYFRIKRENEKKLKNKILEPDVVTVVIMSAGRKDYLQKSIVSLRENLIYDPAKLRWYIIDDYPASLETRKYIQDLDGFDLKILNPKNLGLGYSLNRIYMEVRSEFVFHCEDDQIFLRPIFLEEIISLLRENSYLRQMCLYRMEPDGRKLTDVSPTDKGFVEVTSKFGFPPHVARTQLFIENQPFPLHYAELEYTLKLERNGYNVGGMLGYPNQPYALHIGAERMVRNV